VWDNGLLKEKHIAEMKAEIDNSSRFELEEKTLQAFERFISAL
jgi:hypothetical protein